MSSRRKGVWLALLLMAGSVSPLVSAEEDGTLQKVAKALEFTGGDKVETDGKQQDALVQRAYDLVEQNRRMAIELKETRAQNKEYATQLKKVYEEQERLKRRYRLLDKQTKELRETLETVRAENRILALDVEDAE